MPTPPTSQKRPRANDDNYETAASRKSARTTAGKKNYSDREYFKNTMTFNGLSVARATPAREESRNTPSPDLMPKNGSPRVEVPSTGPTDSPRPEAPADNAPRVEDDSKKALHAQVFDLTSDVKYLLRRVYKLEDIYDLERKHRLDQADEISALRAELRYARDEVEILRSHVMKCAREGQETRDRLVQLQEDMVESR